MITITDTKRLVLSTVFILAIFLVSCNKNSSSQNSNDQSTNSGTSLIDGLASAITSGDSYRCEYTNQTTNATGEYLVKNKKFKLLGQEIEGKKSTIIVNDMGMYMWSEGQNQGFFYPTLSSSSTDQNSKAQSQFGDYINPEIVDQKEKVSCQKASIDDSEFSPPASVTFQDFSKLMDTFTNPASNPDINLPDLDLNNLPSIDQ